MALVGLRHFQTRALTIHGCPPAVDIVEKGKAGHSHLNVSKRPGRKNRLSGTAYSNSMQTSMLKKLLPYG
jgi:hypothetical protein